MRTKKNPPLTEEEAEELRQMRKEAKISLSKIAEYMHCTSAKIELLERRKTGADPEFLERLKKRYQLIIKYKDIE